MITRQYSEDGENYYETDEGYPSKPGWWRECDEQGRVLHSWENTEYGVCDENWTDYDKQGHKIHWKDREGNEEWYDKQGREIRRKDDRGREWINKYDERGKLIYTRDGFTGEELWNKYDERGNLIRFYRKCRMSERTGRYEYDEQSRLIHAKESNGDEKWITYFPNGDRREKIAFRYALFSNKRKTHLYHISSSGERKLIEA
jgi:YD repeat-containing protein